MFDEEDVKFWNEVLSVDEEGEFPRCNRCFSKKPFETECLDWKTNVWKVKCLDCGLEKTKKHAMAVYENKNGELWINGIKAGFPSWFSNYTNQDIRQTKFRNIVFRQSEIIYSKN